ncbi:MAG: lycopene cyclase domain-containing protein, partial [Chloroflexota bacterium]
MTYLGFLFGFLVIPIITLLLWLLWSRRWRFFSFAFPIGYSFLLLATLATLYTTPWDNYLVATRVWWYDPALVLGLTIGWVPVEEYLFFILQPVLGGLILLYLFSRKRAFSPVQPLTEDQARDPEELSGVRFRRWSLVIAFAIWVASLATLIIGEPATTYLSLELAWALPVIILQLAFGGDILWQQRRKVIFVILLLTVYLSAADALAIQSGVWTINPAKSLGILLGGVLPVEEFVFFLLTNVMVAFGFVLIWSPQSLARLKGILSR